MLLYRKFYVIEVVTKFLFKNDFVNKVKEIDICPILNILNIN